MSRKRFIAFPLIALVAIASSLGWSDLVFNPVNMAINLGAAAIGCLVLHLKWRRAELRGPHSPDELKDTFS